MKKIMALWLISLSLCTSSFATGTPEDSLQALKEYQLYIDSIEAALNYKNGKITLGNGIATINVPKGFKFLEAEEAKYVIEKIWGNPPGSAPLGLLFPENSGATDPGSYAFIIAFEDIGYVKDKDANDINYDDLLKTMKEESAADNAERVKAGSYAMDLVGWATKPRYDEQRKVLYWAKEFAVDEQDHNTLNYDVRLLGRNGVLTLQAISAMDQLDSVNNHINDVLAMVEYNDGHKYSQFNSSTDKVAAWTIGGLVAGKILAKAGLWAVIAKSLKFIIAGIALFGAAIWRFVTGRKKKEPEYVYEPQPAPEASNRIDPPAV